MDQVGPAVLVLGRDHHAARADSIAIAAGPAVLTRDHADPLGPQRVQLDRRSARVLEHLHEGIAVEQHLRRDHFEQRLGSGGGADQRGEFGIVDGQRRPADSLGNDPYRTLRHRVAAIGRPRGARVIEMRALRGQGLALRRADRRCPGRDIAARQRHPRAIAPALEGGGQCCEEGHSSSPFCSENRHSRLRGNDENCGRSKRHHGYTCLIRGLPRPPGISSVSAHTNASARSGDRPGPS